MNYMQIPVVHVVHEVRVHRVSVKTREDSTERLHQFRQYRCKDVVIR